jgi:succinyl-diaminopimelate desuccinylase
MKGALAIMMTLGEGLTPRGGGDSGLGLVFYDCEETSFERNGLRPLFEAEPWLKKLDLALILEPTDNVVELGCLGSLHGRVVFTGTAAHSARPWTGENAIHKGAPFLTRLTELPERELAQGPVVFREVISVTLATGGTTRNVIPDRFELNVNLRFAPDRTTPEAESYFRSLLPPGASLEIVDMAPAAPARFDCPHLRRLVEEQEIMVRAKQAWTDVAQFAEQGVPAANFGPGIPELAHRREERVPVENLVCCHEMLHRFLSHEEGEARDGG